MSGKKLLILAAAAVVLVLLAVVQRRFFNRTSVEPAGPSYLIEGFDPDSIDSIVIGVGAEAVTIKRGAKGFVVVNKDGYPARAEQINELLGSCMDIRTEELYTDDAANHEDLEITEEKADSVVKFLQADSSVLTGVVIGKAREDGTGTYVRLVSSDKVYLSSKRPWIKDKALDYIEQELISLERERIEWVTVDSNDGKYTLKASEKSEKIVLEDVPAGKQLKTSDGESVFTALTSLRFDDVNKASEGLNFVQEYACKLTDSTVYRLKLAEKDDKTYATCRAVFTDKSPVMKEKGVEFEEELKKKEAKLLARDKAMNFSARHKGWVYEIADWKAKNLTKKLSELLEERTEEPEKTADPNAVKADESAPPKPKEAESVEEKAAGLSSEPDDPEEPEADKAREPNEVEAAEPEATKPTEPNAVKAG